MIYEHREGLHGQSSDMNYTLFNKSTYKSYTFLI